MYNLYQSFNSQKRWLTVFQKFPEMLKHPKIIEHDAWICLLHSFKTEFSSEAEIG
jgi:hypothetical protein